MPRYGEGSITERKDGRFQVRVRVAGKDVYRYAGTRAEAEKIRRHLAGQLRRGLLRPDPPKLRLGELLDRWLATKAPPAVSDRARAVYERRVRLYLTPSLGHLRAADLAPGDVDEWLRLLVTTGLATATIAQCRSLLSEALEWGADRELVARNVARRIRAPKGAPPAVRVPPSPEEGRAFLAAFAGHRLAPLWHLAAYLGLRRGELLGLTWGAVDLERGTLRVESQLLREAGDWVLRPPKSAAGSRELPLVAPLPDLLAGRREGQRAERGTAPVRLGLDLVFTTPDGRPCRADTVRVWQRQHAARAGVANIDLHRFRHGVATALLHQDAPGRIIQAYLGHSRVTVTDRYLHVTAETLRPWAERVATLWRPRSDEEVVSNAGDA